MTIETQQREDTRRLLQSLAIAAMPERAPSRLKNMLVAGPLALVVATLAVILWPRQEQEDLQSSVAVTASELPRGAVQAPNAPAASASGGLDASGFVVARQQATVSADVTGRLTRILVDEGASVKRGDVLAELDARVPSAQVAFAQAQISSARKTAAVTETRIVEARQKLQRLRELATKAHVSTSQLETATNELATLDAQLAVNLSDVDAASRQFSLQEEQLRSTRIVAPFDGVVTQLAAHVGEIVSPMSAGGGFTRTGICTIVDLDSIEGEVNISEQYLGRIGPGQTVEIRSQAYPGDTFGGKVIGVTASVDRNTAAVKVRVSFDRPDRKLIPGMRIDLSFAPMTGS